MFIPCQQMTCVMMGPEVLRESTRRRLKEPVEDIGELNRAAMARCVGGFADLPAVA
jgi:hypothetical protein